MLFFSSIGLLFAYCADATEVKGVWVKNVKDWVKRASICERALATKNNEILVNERDVFVVTDNEIIWVSATCKIKAHKDEGHFIRLFTDCPAELAENELVFRVEGPDELTRIFPGMSRLNTAYFRCPKASMP
jgi:hypothetical protein